ncbi:MULTISPECIES: NrfD/PsrC family molybdoenzyme membrane anchor subunit [Shewanella]|uniref:Thiosulfate reductase gamma subunit n=1 Tax=Shewanella chilikensis TaxID=558541 RepID=A0ABX5PPN8_9GAMM|nr:MULTISPECIES: NrfD/PsrC family molybdoenzyme membrane anchor subunit [Shewanella]MBO2597953.1 polysulfide reductase NrfD [Shewanella algae]MCA0948626.1 polysulfide reductase NrfD [Shewanella chilikensis]MCE9850835.1 polysulfide reductase NrfD [Shewanella chilikensis]MCL1154319.1 polysulfide reductase NrfD [Shewanella chilikensis]PYE59032.1 thiosulfate reductase gamma subunit [Shewanella chilikensis]
MNNTWGDMTQYDPVTWNWVIAVYLFLAGLSAGSLLIGIGLRWVQNKTEGDSGLLKAAALIAPVAICLGMLCLVFDLTKPFHFWLILINYNLTSVMSIGVLALLAYIPLTFAYALVVLKDDLGNWGLGFLKGIAESLTGLRKTMEVLLFVLAIVVGAYTGFLISAMNAYPMLNTAVLPALFLVSGLSAGAAANAVVALLLFKTDKHCPQLGRMHGLELPIMAAEILFLFMLFCALYFKGGAAAAALASLTSGVWASVFWIGVVGIGFGIPLLSMLLLPASTRHTKGAMLAVACCSLTGVLALRHFILYAGQSYLG